MTAARIGLFGRGRLGSAIASAAGPRLAWSLGRDGAPRADVDVAIDASAGPAVAGHVSWAISNGVDLVIGATGFDLPGLRDRVGDRIGVVVAPNFSLGVALYARLSLVLARYAALDSARDPYIVEHHHARKKDAPSGTARMLAKVVMNGCPRKTEFRAPGEGELPAHALNVSAIRAGHTYSTHVVGVDAPAETLELHHASRSAAAYAAGAIASADWIRGKRGVFTFNDFAEDALRPLFENVVLQP